MQLKRGFTLVELMVTIAVMAIIAMIAAPSFGNILYKQQLNTNTRELISTLSQARSQAVILRKDTTVHLMNGTNTETDYYWQTTANNSVISPSSISQIVFNKEGAISSGITADTDFIICNSKSGTTRVFALTKMGTIYVKAEGTC